MRVDFGAFPVWIVVGVLLSCILAFAQRILFALAVYYDARANGNPSSAAWALLVGFLGLIPGVIYLCVRRNPGGRLIYCGKCGAVHPISLPNCPQCGVRNDYSLPFCDPALPAYAGTARGFLIAALAVFAGMVVLFILCVALLALWILPEGAYIIRHIY